MKPTFLQYNSEWAPEFKGDYLGSKIPSLLEFLENKIHMREVLGLSKIKSSKNAPKAVPHITPTSLRQEELL